MKLTKFSLVLRILRGVACVGAIEGINIADIESDIIEKYDLTIGSQLEIHSISADNTISNGSKSYSLDDAIPFSIFTHNATYMFEGEEQQLPEASLDYKYIDEELVLISRATDGSTYGVSIYSNEGNLRVQYEKVGINQFVLIKSDHVNTKLVNERFRYGVVGSDKLTNFENVFSSHKSKIRKSQGACTIYKVIELAVAWESSFCSRNGSKKNADQKAIQIVAGVSAKYQQTGLCTKIKISHMEGYCKPSTDPYKQYVDLNNSGCGNTGLLQGFRDYWNDNRSSIHRDDAQLFSGTGLECSDKGCVIGCANLSALCDNLSYGVNYASFTSNANLVEVLVAHELGHNCGGYHYDVLDHIMYPSVNSAGQGFSQTSIKSFLNQFSRSTCIGDETKPDICTTGTWKTCAAFGCIWEKGKCTMCSTLSKTNSKTCAKAGCNWVKNDQDKCQSCNKGSEKAECNKMNCVWKKVNNISRVCTPCAAIKPTSKNKCKRAGCAFSKKKCASCRTISTEKMCKKQKGCAWSGGLCSMDLS